MKRNLLLLAMLTIFSACEQIGTTISGTFSNIISGRAFSNSSADDTYNAMKTKSLAKPAVNSVTPNCNPLEGITPLSGKDSGNMSKIKDNICTCQAWGTCDSKSCSCENLCPNDFGIFKKVSFDDQIKAENTLAFYNKKNKFSDQPTYQGYCWGIALITQRFNRMATFSPTAEKKFQNAGQDSERIRHYKDIIARLNNNEVVTIPGFKNLQEFSADPEVKDLLENSVKELWSQNALNTQGLGMVTSSKTASKPEMNKLFDDVEFRLKNNLSPSLVYNEKDAKTDAHVLLVNGSGVRKETGERYLCLRDNNLPPLNSLKCNIKMVLRKDGSVIREMADGKLVNRKTKLPIPPLYLGKVELAQSENPNTIEQISNLHTKCAGEKGCPKTSL